MGQAGRQAGRRRPRFLLFPFAAAVVIIVVEWATRDYPTGRRGQGGRGKGGGALIIIIIIITLSLYILTMTRTMTP